MSTSYSTGSAPGALPLVGHSHKLLRSPLGFLESRRGLRRIKHIRFDYVHGRLLKVIFCGGSVDITGFDRQYGPGAASRVVDHIR